MEFASFESGKAKLGGPSVGWVAQACKGAKEARENASEVKIPVLLLHAGADKVVTKAGQKEFCDNLNASSPGLCKWIEIPNAYHELFIENDDYRKKAIAEMFKFFDRYVER